MKKANFITIICLFVGILTTNAQIIETYAGNGTVGYSGDGGAATSAEIHSPGGLAYLSGSLYFSDAGNSRIRVINSSGIISTYGGNGTAGYYGDGGAATSAEINTPKGLAMDTSGNLYIADEANNRIRKISATGTITTVAGNGTAGYSGDGGAATSAELHSPYGVAIDASGNLYIADEANNRIRKVNTSGTISTCAGTGTAGFSGDGGAATSAELSHPINVSVDASGNVYIVDYSNNRIRKISTSGIISTVAGNGTAGYSGDGGAATSAEINMSTGVAEMDGSGNLYIADDGNERIRVVNTSGVINTVAGDGTAGYSGDGGEATSAELYTPSILKFDNAGNYYISDALNSRIRVVYLSLNVSASVSTNVSCNGGSNGSVSVSVTHGTSPYTYHWSPGGQTTSSVTGLSAGTDTVTVLDQKDIGGYATITITEPTYLSVNTGAQTSIVCLGSTDSLSSLVSGGVSPYTYSWSPSGGLSCTTCQNPVATPTASKIYTLTVTDHNGCSNTSSVTIDTSCAGLSCSNPYILLNTNDTTFKISDSVTWISYTPDSVNNGFEIINPSDTNLAYICTAVLYSGSCTGLTALDTLNITRYPAGAKATIIGNDLVNGTTYLVKILANHVSAHSSFNIYILHNISCEYCILPSPCSNCPPTPLCNNLVPNGNFETYCSAQAILNGVCTWPNLNYKFSLSCWDNPNNQLTPDYFNNFCNSCSIGGGQIAGVPYNIMDNDGPMNNVAVDNHTNGGPTGGYAGIFAAYYTSSITTGSGSPVNTRCSCSPFDYKEYIQNKLSLSLVSGNKYFVTFFIYLAPNSPCAVDPQDIGMFFSNYQPTNLQYCNASLCESGSLLDNSGNVIGTSVTDAPYLITAKSAGANTGIPGQWVEVTQPYTANGGEDYITIGNFFDCSPSDLYSTGVPATSSYVTAYSAYYYIDDVSIVNASDFDIASSSNSEACPGEQYTLTPTGSATSGLYYEWNDGETTSSITVSPTTTTTYTLTGTSSGGCVYYATYTIPVINITYTGARSLCDNEFNTQEGVLECCTPEAQIPLSATVSGVPSATYSWTTNLPSPASVENNYTSSPTLVIPDVGDDNGYPNWAFWEALEGTGFEVTCQACYGDICCSQTFTVTGCCTGNGEGGSLVYYDLIDPDINNSSTLNMTHLNTSSISPGTGGENTGSYTGYNIIVDSTSSPCNCWAIEGVNSLGSADCQVLAVMGTMLVDKNLVILNSEITIAGLSKIQLSNGAKLIIDDSHIHNCGDDMWDGIYVPNGCSLVVRNGSVIENASQAAIVSVDGGSFNVQNSTLNDNYVGIQVEAYAGAHSGYISNSQILNNDLDPGSNYPPYNSGVNPTFTNGFNPLFDPEASEFPIAGILIDSVGSITIGDHSASANTFQNEYDGINSYNSNVNIYNNNFYYMNYCNTCSNNSPQRTVPAGVYARGNSTATPNTVNVGSSLGGTYSNTFNNSVTGVFERDTVNLNVIKNTFGYGSYNEINDGVIFEANFKTKINITSNDIYNVEETGGLFPPGGVLGQYNPYSISIITLNSISANTNTNYAYGVRTMEALPTLGTIYDVNNNTISGTEYGVFVNGTRGESVKENTITTNAYLSSGSNEGIEVAWGINGNIYHNTTNAHNNGDGIRIDYSMGLLNFNPNYSYDMAITCNNTYTSYNGLYFSGPQANDLIDQNSMSTYTGNGLFINATGAIYTQGSAIHGTANTWNPSNSCTSNTVPYATYSESANPGAFFVTTATCPGNPTDNKASAIPPGMAAGFTSGAGSDCFNCEFDQPCPLQQCNTCNIRTAQIVIHNHTPYKIDSTSTHWMEKFELYASVSANDSSYVDSATGMVDSTIHSFMDSAATANIGDIYGILTVLGDTNGISTTDIGTAISLLSSISSPDTVELTFKQVLTVYTGMLASGQNTPDSTQTIALQAIAPLCPELYGPGVYTARALLASVDSTLYVNTCELMPDSVSRDFLRPGKHVDSTSIPNVAFNLYPNPNNGNFTIAYNVGTLKGCKVELYNTLGEAIGEYSLSGSSGTMNISNPMLSNGIYIWKIYSGNQALKFGKVIIIK